jgi:hypothetical protein
MSYVMVSMFKEFRWELIVRFVDFGGFVDFKITSKDRGIHNTWNTHLLPYCEFESRSVEVHSIHHYVIKFVSDLRQVGGVLHK